LKQRGNTTYEKAGVAYGGFVANTLTIAGSGP